VEIGGKPQQNIYAPVSGAVVAVNSELDSTPEAINLPTHMAGGCSG